METKVKKEIEDLKLMARNWKKAFERWVEEDGGPEHAQMEYKEDMEIHLVPYLSRLVELKHVTGQEAGEVLDYFKSQYESLGKEEETCQKSDWMKKSL